MWASVCIFFIKKALDKMGVIIDYGHITQDELSLRRRHWDILNQLCQ